MQSIRFLKEGIKPYMLVPCDGFIINNYHTEVLQQIKIPYFMMYEIREYNGKRILYYVLRHRTTMKSVLEHFPLTPEITKNILVCFISAMQCIDEHLMYMDRIVWKMDRIFMEVGTGHLEFCYNPMEKQDNGQLAGLVEEIMQMAGEQNKEVMDMLTDFYQLITNPEATLEDYKQYRKDVFGEDRIPEELYSYRTSPPLIEVENLKKIKNPDEAAIVEQYDMQRKDNVTRYEVLKIVLWFIGYINVFILVFLMLGILPEKNIWILYVGLGVFVATGIYYLLMDKTESIDSIMEEYLETVPEYKETRVLANQYLAEDMPDGYYLVPNNKNDGPPIYIDKETGVLGSLESCDYVFNREGVSRMHLKVTQRNDSLFIEDLNSTNGTQIEGKRAEAGKEYEVFQGRVIGVAGHGLYIDKL